MNDQNNLTREDHERFRLAKRKCPAIAEKLNEIDERNADRLRIRVRVGRRRVDLSRAEAVAVIESLAGAVARPEKWGVFDIEIAEDRA